MSTLFRWIGNVGPDWDSMSGTITNWLNISDGTNTIVPISDTGDVAVFDDGGIHTVSVDGDAADQISITGNTDVTFTDGDVRAGAFLAENNADFPDDLVVDGDSKLVIASGAGLQNTGTVDVVGLGNDLFGGAGSGSLEVDSGGNYEAEALIIGDGTAGNGFVTINDALGFFVVAPFGGGSGDGELTIGQMGTGSLDVTGTPNVFTTSAVLGLNQGAVGAMSLDSSIWGGGDVTIGAAGVGHMTIGSGAVVALFDIVVGAAQSGNGDLSVTGASFGVDFLTVGQDGTGTATFEAGSTGTFAAVTVGESADAIANLTLNGSTWNTGSLTIGLAGTGHATAGAGEVITVNNAVLGSGQDASGDLTLDDAALNGGTVAIGQDGMGDLEIGSGSTGSVAAVVVGEDAGSGGTLTIDDSDWSVGSLTVGLTGTGQATIGAGAVATIDNVLIGPNGDLAVTEDAGSVGTVIAQQVSIDFGLLDLSQGGQVLIGAATGTNGAVAIGNKSSLIGLGSLNGDVVLSNGGLVQAMAAVPGALKIDGNITGTGTGTGTIEPLMTLEVNGGIDTGVDIAFSPSAGAQVGVLVLDVPDAEQGTITGFSEGNTIDIQGSLYTDVVFTQGAPGTAGTLTLSGGAFAPLSLAVSGAYASDSFTATPGLTDTIVTVVPCFATGTRIETATGPVAVEDLCIGDRLVTVDGTFRPVIRVERRRIDCTRHRRPEQVWPVRIAAGAFGENVPVRDLYLSPDHAVFVDNALVPVKLLINATSIIQVVREDVTYCHVELPRHEVIFAEGLSVESYLDIGDATSLRFSRDILRLLPDVGQRTQDVAAAWDVRCAAPLIVSGEKLAMARRATWLLWNRKTTVAAT